MKIQRKQLTSDQYRRANKLTAVSFSVVYAILLILNFTSDYVSVFRNKLIFAGIYIIWYLATALITQKNADNKKAMIALAFGFEMSYCLLVMTTYSVSMLLIFPVLLTIVVYYNEAVFLWGAISSLVIMLTKSTIIRFNGTGTDIDFKIINLALMGMIICIVGGFRAISLLIKFSEEETDAVAELLDSQKEIAKEINDVAESVAEEFVGVLSDLENINDTVGTTSIAMNNIADGSEETATSATRQATMTNEIQDRLENTNRTAASAKETAEELKNAITGGKQRSDELERQSRIVDEYTNKISVTISDLVDNVEKVSEITDTILNISAQTNLLALNASIEAARAGEAGAGFAVVADQIRKLAEETKSSTELITGIMDELSDVTSKAKEAADGSVESIALQREQIKAVNESFQIIDNGIIEMADGVNSMNNEVVAVLEANSNIVSSVDTLVAISEEMSSNAMQGANDMTTLADSMGKFTDVINQTSNKLNMLKEKAAQ